MKSSVRLVSVLQEGAGKAKNGDEIVVHEM